MIRGLGFLRRIFCTTLQSLLWTSDDVRMNMEDAEYRGEMSLSYLAVMNFMFGHCLRGVKFYLGRLLDELHCL